MSPCHTLSFAFKSCRTGNLLDILVESCPSWAARVHVGMLLHSVVLISVSDAVSSTVIEFCGERRLANKILPALGMLYGVMKNTRADTLYHAWACGHMLDFTFALLHSSAFLRFPQNAIIPHTAVHTAHTAHTAQRKHCKQRSAHIALRTQSAFHSLTV